MENSLKLTCWTCLKPCWWCWMYMRRHLKPVFLKTGIFLLVQSPNWTWQIHSDGTLESFGYFQVLTLVFDMKIAKLCQRTHNVDILILSHVQWKMIIKCTQH